jgi:hypothetical protein
MTAGRCAVLQFCGLIGVVLLFGVTGLGAAIPRSAADDVYSFSSPSGNIVCGISAESVTCDIGDHTYTPPPRPDICQGGWADRINLSADGPAPGFGRCHTDTAIRPGLPILNYGDSVQRGSIVCSSAFDGITCATSATGHSFRISRESYELN